MTIPAGSLIDLHLYAANVGEAVVGSCPLALRPGRELQAGKVGPAVMGLGDGSQRSPGSYVALQEPAVFLQLCYGCSRSSA